jgi:hypothetical protein
MWHGAVHSIVALAMSSMTSARLRYEDQPLASGRSTSGGTMRRVVLSFWISLDGYSCDEGTELYRVMQEMPDD